MKAPHPASTLVTDLLKDGQRDAAEIMAAAEGARISERAVQRAAVRLGVVKSKSGFSAGWVWKLPEEAQQQKVGADETTALQGGRVKNTLLAVADGDTANTGETMTELVQLAEGQPVTTTLAIAEGIENREVSIKTPREPPAISRAEVIATRLRKLEAGRGKKAPIYAADPRLARWVGISDPDLREAYELAVFALESSSNSQAPLTVGFLEPYVRKSMNL